MKIECTVQEWLELVGGVKKFTIDVDKVRLEPAPSSVPGRWGDFTAGQIIPPLPGAPLNQPTPRCGTENPNPK